MHLVRFLFSSLFVEKFHICFDLEFVRCLKFQTLFNKTVVFRGITICRCKLSLSQGSNKIYVINCEYIVGKMQNAGRCEASRLSLLWKRKRVFALDFKLILGFEN